MPKRADLPVKREKKRGSIARTSWFTRKKGKEKRFQCPDELVFR
ncbi:hypothetical protein [Neobacillus niacini]|nr:hypothetical protein [Neobacillus niacini]MDR7000509.1 hypothetical protein [Neobacillus niacini]